MHNRARKGSIALRNMLAALKCRFVEDVSAVERLIAATILRHRAGPRLQPAQGRIYIHAHKPANSRRRNAKESDRHHHLREGECGGAVTAEEFHRWNAVASRARALPFYYHSLCRAEAFVPFCPCPALS